MVVEEEVVPVDVEEEAGPDEELLLDDDEGLELVVELDIVLNDELVEALLLEPVEDDDDELLV